VTLDYAQLFRALRPETALVLGALLVLALDLTVFRRHPREKRLRLALAIAALAVVVGMIHIWGGVQGAAGLGANWFPPAQPGKPADSSTLIVFGDVLRLDPLGAATRFAVLVLTLLTLGVVRGARVLRHPAEYVAIILFATTGLLLMAVARNLLLAFLALELASLSLYILAGLDKTRPESAEAALKYFLVGGVSAAFLLYGLSLIYGLTHSIDLTDIARQLPRLAPSPLLLIALVMIVVAFGFKVAAAPFHPWAPDVYEGAPVPSAALIASASKLAGFVLFTRLLWSGFGRAAGDTAVTSGPPNWLPALIAIAAASMLLGNLGALAQRNVRRLLAYSAIAHAGALLLGVLIIGSGGTAGVRPLFYYAATYGLATVGTFGVIAVVDRAGACRDLSDLAGLHRRSPLLAGCLAVFILSLAGIPPLAGFFGKFWVFAVALKIDGVSGPLGWLALLGLALSAVSLYYYLLILKPALVAPPAESSPRIAVPLPTALALIAAAGLLVGLGVAPAILIQII
jgi:NADH-quinone oxidoreductase subunit N